MFRDRNAMNEVRALPPPQLDDAGRGGDSGPPSRLTLTAGRKRRWTGRATGSSSPPIRATKSDPLTQTPAALGFSMPAKWERHDATWLGWPHHKTDRPDRLDTIRESVFERRRAAHRLAASSPARWLRRTIS